MIPGLSLPSARSRRFGILNLIHVYLVLLRELSFAHKVSSCPSAMLHCKAWRIPAVLLKFLTRIVHGVLELHILWIEAINSSQLSNIAEPRLFETPNVVFPFFC